jgi:hypothetical protein
LLSNLLDDEKYIVFAYLNMIEKFVVEYCLLFIEETFKISVDTIVHAKSIIIFSKYADPVNFNNCVWFRNLFNFKHQYLYNTDVYTN